MGFFDFSEQEKAAQRQPELKGLSIELLHKRQCLVCPLNTYEGARNPHMLPTGSDKPLVYMLGERPRKADDRTDDHFTGEVGEVLRMRIPDDWLDDIRFNNIVRTKTPEGRVPSMVEIECCRPSIVKDIEETKPRAIFGFGPAVLDWAIKETHIQRWMGRHVPVKIGKHTCWFFPMLEPGFVLESRKFAPRGQDSYGSDMEFAFATHLKHAFELIEKLRPPNVMPEGEVFRDVEIVTGEGGDADVERVLAHLKYAAKQSFVGFDYETNTLRPYRKGAKLLTCGVATADKAIAFPLRHRQSPWTQRQLDRVEDALEDFLYTSQCRKISHQLSFEHEWTGVKFGRKAVLTDTWECSVSQAFILNETPYTNSLDFLCKQYFGLRIKGLSDVDRKNLDAVDLKEVLRYNGADAKFHRLLFFAQRAVLQEQGLQRVYELQRDRVATFVLTQMEGVPVDQAVANDFFADYNKRLKKIERRIVGLDVARQYKKRFGEEFSPSNNHHVKRMLQNVMHLKVDATNEKAIKDINHEFTRALLTYRSVAKNLGTYVEPVLTGSENVFPDGMLHPIISTTKVRTNRTSSEDPNIQNWPKHKEGKVIRKVVRPSSDDLRVVSIDFSGIQARNVAMESRDETLVEQFWNNYDIHTDWRDRILRTYPKWMTREQRQDKEALKEYRQRAKNQFVFASFFGAHAKTLSRGLGIPELYCEQLREEWYDTFPGVEKWHKQLMRDFEEMGYVTGLSGFRRRAPIAANQIINSPIQADEALIVCDAMGRLSRKGRRDLQPILMVHDDLTFIWHKRDFDANADECIYEMVQKKFDWINVPLGVEISVGRDWHTMEKVGEYVWTKDGYKEVPK